MTDWDIFVCHTEQDEAAFVKPLALRLRDLAVRVWYDRFELLPGDRLSERIGEGLARCRCRLLVISKSFLGRPWTAYEPSGLVNRFVEEGTRLVPIWLDVSRQDVAALNPALADLLAIRGNPNNIETCALEVLRVVRPRLYENLSMLTAAETENARIVTRDFAELKADGPIRHHDLPSELLVRIQNVWFALRDVLSPSLKETIENFQRDLRPEREILAWERIVGALYKAQDALGVDDLETRKQLFKALFLFSLGCHDQVFRDCECGRVDWRVTKAAGRAWLDVVPPVAVADVEAEDV